MTDVIREGTPHSRLRPLPDPRRPDMGLGAHRMYAEERRSVIVGLARTEGHVEVAELAGTLDVTPETVRRDLTALERLGLLRRVHGGAILAEAGGVEPALAVREVVQMQEKARIAAAALAWLPEEGAIALDGGSTTRRLAEILPFGRSLTVVTNNLAIALPLADRRDLTVCIVGGRLRGSTLTTVDEVAVEYLRHIHLDVAFLGTNGFSIERGMTTPDSSEAAVKRAFIAAARTKVLLTDHSKFGLDHFAHVAHLAELDAIVTDAALPDAAAAAIEVAGPHVLRA